MIMFTFWFDYKKRPYRHTSPYPIDVACDKDPNSVVLKVMEWL